MNNAATHPGIILKDKMDVCGMSRRELSARTGVTEKHICTIINGDKPISKEFAKKLGYAFEGCDSLFWMKVQAEYDNYQFKLQEENDITVEERAILKNLKDITPDLIQSGYMHNNCGDSEKVLQLRSFLNVSDLRSIPNITYNAAYRAQLNGNCTLDPYVLFAWQRICEKATEAIVTSPTLNLTKLRDELHNIKHLMFGAIQNGVLALQRILAECGIAFAVVKNYKGAPVQGFIKKTNEGRLILCLTIRRRRADTFWFTLFHEIAHILNKDFETRFVDFDSVPGEQETAADIFARDILIAPDQYKAFVHETSAFTWSSISAFAKKVDVQPFIVLGRLQKDKILDWSDYTDHVEKYGWVPA